MARWPRYRTDGQDGASCAKPPDRTPTMWAGSDANKGVYRDVFELSQADMMVGSGDTPPVGLSRLAVRQGWHDRA